MNEQKESRERYLSLFMEAVKFIQHRYPAWDGTADGQGTSLMGCANMIAAFLGESDWLAQRDMERDVLICDLREQVQVAYRIFKEEEDKRDAALKCEIYDRFAQPLQVLISEADFERKPEVENAIDRFCKEFRSWQPESYRLLEAAKLRARLEEAGYWRWLVIMPEDSYFATEGDKHIAELGGQLSACEVKKQ
jgi:hypothetical protein